MNNEAYDLQRLAWEQAIPRARQGDMGYVGELGARLAQGLDAAAKQVSAYTDGLARVVRILALTPGRDSLTELIRLLDEHGPFGRAGTGAPLVASLLAEAHRPADLAELLYDRAERDELDELRSCLFHELLLRGVDMAALRPLRDWPASRPGWHFLSWLPADLRPFESGARFPSRSIDGGGTGSGSTRLGEEGRLDPPTPRTTERSPLRDIATAEVHEAIVAVPEGAEFGNSGAWVFALDEPLDPSLVPALVPTLPMPCVAGLGPTARFEIARRPLEDIWQILFSTVSMGGCYGRQALGAFGRRKVWWSLAGLSGAPLGASAEEVERYAVQSTWFRFECDSGWFHNEFQDYGIAALSPDRRRIAVLAATDTD
ncbi:DUF6183 family protein [Streptomyces sp. NBC_01565]|uniref:DUF6183 family protein n=1 Tax=Streptomyces sp. NBC_01565 TaxID=2975881 RepID=UPI00224D191C|nr:DUF6183 family protein [Streptomyces sp. NBC_01565]MCX4545430.1 DUF6183 family protein [Streptomyces sp. NBC_01565]